MSEVRVIEIKKSIFDANKEDADSLRKYLNEKKVFFLNVMSSPGSGKTKILIRVINEQKNIIR